MAHLQRPVMKIFVASRIKDMFQALKTALQSADLLQDTVVEELETLNNTVLFCSGSRELDSRVEDIEILFGDAPYVRQVVSHPGNKVKWAQSTFAGVEKIMKRKDELKPQPGFILTRTTNQFGQEMSEYVIGEVIARERQFTKMDELQRQKLFDEPAVREYRTLKQLTIGILGLGTIGSEIARLCKAFNMTVLAAVRDEKLTVANKLCEHVHHFSAMSSLDKMLEQCDYVVSVLPSTPDTRGLLSGKVLKACQKKKSVLISIGRGDVIDDDSLINAINNGWLGGAVLDVFNTEPLPSSSPLWTLPGVTITPHVSGVTTADNCVEEFIKNLLRYKKGEPLLQTVDLESGY